MATSKSFTFPGKKRKRNVNLRALKQFQNNLNKVGRVLPTDLTFHAMVVGLGTEKELKPRDPSKNFSFKKQELYILVGSLQHVDLKNRLVAELNPPKNVLLLKGSWDNNSAKHFESIKLADPSFVTPQPTSDLYLKEGGVYKISGKYAPVNVGDIIKLIGVRLTCTKNTKPEAIEAYGPDSGWFQFNSFIRKRPLIIKDRLQLLEEGGFFTTYVEPYVLGQRPGYNQWLSAYILALGPNCSYFEDPITGRYFQLDINYETTSFEVPAGKEEKEKAAQAVGLSVDDPDAPKVYQMGLAINVAGIQGRVCLETGEEINQSFLFDIMIFPWEKIDFEKTDVRPGCIFDFGIVSRGVWKTVMPAYFRMMNFALVAVVNWKRTDEYAGRMTASEGGVETYVEDLYDDEKNWRLGGNKQGVSADDAKKKLNKFGFDDDEDDDEDDGHKNAKLKGKNSASGEGSGVDGGEYSMEEYDEIDAVPAVPQFDFAYNLTTQSLVFDAKEFWTTHAIHVSPETAQALYTWYARFEKVHKGDKGDIPFKRMPEDTANELFRRTDIISTTCGFLGSERLVDIDETTGKPSINGIDGFYVAVPWRNLNPEYLPHLEAMSLKEGDALVAHLYNWPVFVKKRSIPSLSDPSMLHAKALFELEGGKPFFTEKPKENAHYFVPALFVTWKSDNEESTPDYIDDKKRTYVRMIPTIASEIGQKNDGADGNGKTENNAQGESPVDDQKGKMAVESSTANNNDDDDDDDDDNQKEIQGIDSLAGLQDDDDDEITEEAEKYVEIPHKKKKQKKTSTHKRRKSSRKEARSTAVEQEEIIEDE